MGKTEISLNAEQQAAVNTRKGPVLVVAGAGTGKTRVIVERILALLEEGVDPASILALTFTEKATIEMIDRINERRGGFSLDLTIATYNGFGDQLLTRFGADIGLGSYRLLGDTGQLVFLREHLDELELDYFAPIARPDSQLDMIVGYISELKQHVVLPDTYLDYAKRLPNSTEEEQLEKQKHTELARVYKLYNELCRKQHVIDYDDQLYLSVQLLHMRPNIRSELHKQYAYILVDEFQDTNPLQSKLLELLANNDQNLFVVGDDDQSIYGWRGATLANILGFTERYPDATQITLIENYRSTQPILDASYRLIQHNNPNRLEITNKLNKRLMAQSKDGPKPTVRHFFQLEQELNWVAQDIARRLKGGQEPSSIAVLARRNNSVERVHEALELFDIPHAVTGLRNNLYDALSVASLIEILTACNDPFDQTALYHTLTGPAFLVDPLLLGSYASQARREFISLAEMIRASDNEAAVAALDLIDSWRQKTTSRTVGQIAYDIITDSGWKTRLYNEARDDPWVAQQVEALQQFFGTLKEFERISGVASLQSYVENIPTLRAAGNELSDATLDIVDDAVNILSIHRAKGLEWQTVYVIDCTEGSFPMRSFGRSLKVPEALRSTSAADDHMAEERRLMYVAATRAQHELILTYSDTHISTSKRRPSRFLAELLGDDFTPDAVLSENTQTSLELFAHSTSNEHYALVEHLKQQDIFVLSVSQIACWLRCPQDFYYRYVLRMPEAEDAARAYGTFIHSVIQQIHEAKKHNRQLPIEHLLEQVEEKLPKSGYATKRSRERAYEQARLTVQKLYERLEDEPAPLAIEQSFSVPLSNTNLVITGRIDAILAHGDGIEIRDYKTGDSVRTVEKAKQRATASSQLSLYALAWYIQEGELPKLLTLDFVETGFIGSVKKQQKTIDNLQAKLAQMIQDISDGNFFGGADHSYCSHPL